MTCDLEVRLGDLMIPYGLRLYDSITFGLSLQSGAWYEALDGTFQAIMIQCHDTST